MKVKSSLVIFCALFLWLGVSACTKQQIIVPKVTPEPTHKHHVGKFVWYDLFTHDLQSTVPFYEELFGWSFADTLQGEDRVKTILRDGVPIANAIQIDQVKIDVNESRWLSYLSVDDVDETSMLVEKEKGLIYLAPKDLPDRGRVAVVIDPDGAAFALVNTSDGDPPDEGIMENHWMGSELWTTNIDAATRFYNVLVGYEEKVLAIGIDSTYHLLVKDGQPRAGIVKILWDDVKPNWLPYIAVSDVMAISEHVERLGGTLLVEPDKDIRKGRTAIIADPSGAVFAIQQYEALPPE